jgi:Ca2+-binding RTX toxin-like protein
MRSASGRRQRIERWGNPTMADDHQLRGGAEFLVNTTVYNPQDRPVIAAIAGGFIVAWRDQSRGPTDTTGTSVRAQRFDLAGNKAGAEFQVNTHTYYTQSPESIVSLANGNFVISWFDETKVDGDDDGAVRAAIFTPTGARVGSEFRVNTSANGNQFLSELAPLASGGFVAVYAVSGSGTLDGNNHGVVAQLFAANGSKVGSEFLVNTTIPAAQTDPAVAPLPGGGFVVTWTDYSNAPGDVKMQLFDAAGTKVGGETLVNTRTDNRQSRPEVATLANGGFVITWEDEPGEVVNAGKYDIKAQLFDALGQPVGSEFLVSLEMANGQWVPEVAALPDGGFIISWTDDSLTGGDAAFSAIKAQRFDAQGNRIGSTFLVNEVTQGDQDVGAIAVLSSGAIVFAWDDDSKIGGDTSWTAIKARIFETAIEGSAAQDSLAGGALADRISGLGGNDVLAGGAGDDTISGGDGDDLIDGGMGADRLSGGAGNDIFYHGGALAAGDANDGGEGIDTLVLQGNYPALVLGAASLVAIEGISLQSGTVTRWGQPGGSSYDYSLTLANANAASGQQLRVNAQSLLAGEDFTLNGSAETDGGRLLVYAGFGIDLLTGGSGNDIFFFEAGRLGTGDRIAGGGGNDAVVISGAPAGAAGPVQVTIAAGMLSSVESLSFNGRFASDPAARPSYDVVVEHGNLAGGATLIVNASSLEANQSLLFSGWAAGDGKFRIFGGAGGDRLWGGAGDDVIEGGGLGDALAGGFGKDVFVYRNLSDSAGNAPDVIGDFHFGNDRIDLSLLDADALAPGDQAFAWIGGEAFSGTPGELRVAFDGDMNMWALLGDVNGDGGTDFRLLVSTGAGPPSLADIIL